MALDSLAIEAGSLLVQHAVRNWTGNREHAVSRQAQLVELIPTTVTDRILRRDLDRQLGRIADTVAERLMELCGHEFRGMSEGDKAAALAEVVDTLAGADLSDAALFADDLDEERLTARLGKRMPRRGLEHELGQAGAAFYGALLQECCGCLVRLVVQRPEFLARAQRETLQRVGGVAAQVSALGEQVAAALERMPVRTLDAPEGTAEDAEFTRRYAEHLSTALDYVELFGVSLHHLRSRTALSMAYISLQVSARTDQELVAHRAGWDPLESAGQEPHEYTARVQVEAALAHQRLSLVRGEAGSGKSTLLRWLAITAVRGGFTGELRDWNGLTPFLVKLRSHAEGELPVPEDFPRATAPPLAGQMPRGWAHRRLGSGQALVLVDGVDELPQRRREAVRAWLRELVVAFPKVRVVVTSRPAAAAERWLSAEGFMPVFLEALSPHQTAELVRHWHAAMRDAPGRPCGVEDLDVHAARLLGRLEAAPHLRHLASSPLLAAMLCALNLDRNRLPHNRMDLYAETLDMLLERRDTQRGIPGHIEVGLDRREKLRVLQDLAFRLSSTGRAELPREAARSRIAQQLPSMPKVTAEPEQVLCALLERSGVLREPAVDRVDFVHRTVQEYLTAKQVVHDDDVDYLVDQAHKDTWRETVIMAAGHANGPQARALIRGLRERMAVGGPHRRRLKLLLAACLETLDEVPPDIRVAIDACLDDLVPPRDLRSARSLAAVGEPVLDRLPDSLEHLTAKQARAAVRTAWLVNGPRAINVLTRYATDPRQEVQRELCGAWSYFHPEEYARRVLADAPLERHGNLFIRNSRLLPAARHLTHMRWLQCINTDIPDLDFLWDTALLNLLDLRTVQSGNLNPLLAHAETLSTLVLHSAVPFDTLTPLAALSHLHHLDLHTPPLTNLNFLYETPNITTLGLSNDSLTGIQDLSPITSLSGLKNLDLPSNLGEPHSLLTLLESFPLLRRLDLTGEITDSTLQEIVERTPQLHSLFLWNAKQITDLKPISKLPLHSLGIMGCSRVFDISPVAEISELSFLNIGGTAVADLSPVAKLHTLETLNLTDCHAILNLNPLAELAHLERLVLGGARPGLDLAPLARHRTLTVSIRKGQEVNNRRALGPGVRVKEPL
ncbi:NACHT domain-containing protein [Streptomonospora sp. PA3]|uniref:NACHT N-terminal Helical domain 1-containing protein n=1 Tax=Streptomonospora sp. PA3 TaxID=2607326 RepID=UPI0012DFE434|nr:NACHT domain-containing protein [Streptomonospora sp. PA3]MUL43170.1 NACHT domain-containing protein [Streptomonospora sp. PA3]